MHLTIAEVLHLWAAAAQPRRVSAAEAVANFRRLGRGEPSITPYSHSVLFIFPNRHTSYHYLQLACTPTSCACPSSVCLLSGSSNLPSSLPHSVLISLSLPFLHFSSPNPRPQGIRPFLRFSASLIIRMSLAYCFSAIPPFGLSVFNLV
jgi:hypothetical protein